MFDGNHRSQRPVNLGNRRRGTTTKGRSEILAKSKRQREDRRLEQQRLKLAKQLQSRYRGNVARRQLAAQLEAGFSATSPPQTTPLNVRLRLYYQTNEPEDPAKITQWLKAYAQTLPNTNTPRNNIAAAAQPTATATTPPPPLMHCIVRAVLHVQRNISNPNLLAQILTVAFSSSHSSWPNLGFATGYGRAVQALGTLFEEDNGTTTHAVAASILYAALQRATPTNVPSAQAALGALGLLVGDASVSLEALTNVLSADNSDNNNTSVNRADRDDIFFTVVHDMVTQRAVPLIQRLLQLEGLSTHTAVTLLKVLWLRDPLLQVYTGAVVRGGPAGLTNMLQQQQVPSRASLQQLQQNVSEDVEDDDYSDDDEDGDGRGKTTTTASKATSTKQDFLTLPKLDRLANSEYNTWRNQRLEGAEEKTQEAQLAVQLANPEQWIAWSHDAFRGDPADYVAWLGCLLQHATGLKARQSASSPFLTKLAFAQTSLIPDLFTYCQRTDIPDKYTAWSVFCDILSQQLVAMKDDQFLERYGALAPTIVMSLNDMLHDLYWVHPVKSMEFQGMYERQETARPRVLLTGTKLWNLLYERWCRLVRHSNNFCDESAWWFPIREQQTNNVVGTGDESAMDIESDDDDDNDHPMDESDVLAEAFSDAKMARVLTYVPQALPFERRVRLFQSLLTNDKKRTQDEGSDTRAALFHMMRGEEFDMTQGREKVNIHRDSLYSDSMEALNKLGPRLRRRVQVTFVNQHGAQEAGIDGGGVFKEFIDDLITDAFLTSSATTSTRRFFEVTSQETLAVNTSLPKNTETLTHYEFLGRVLGKAMYESILVDPQFCLPFLNQLLGKQNSLEDLKNYDLEYYRNLTKLLSLSEDDISSLGMTFELTMNNEDGSRRNVELMKGGRHISVTKQNVIQYVHLVAYQRLNIETSAQTKAFLRGFRDLVPASWVRLFSAHELQKLISGDDSVRGIDVTSLKQAMQYASGYHPSQAVVQWFWEIVENEMTADQQRKLLKFMTSCSRQPLLGFQSLEPAPCLQQIRIPNVLRETDNVEALAKQTPLPTASTCMNLLKLPNYPSKKLMKWKLLAAIEAGAGFELT